MEKKKNKAIQYYINVMIDYACDTFRVWKENFFQRLLQYSTSV